MSEGERTLRKWTHRLPPTPSDWDRLASIIDADRNAAIAAAVEAKPPASPDIQANARRTKAARWPRDHTYENGYFDGAWGERERCLTVVRGLRAAKTWLPPSAYDECILAINPPAPVKATYAGTMDAVNKYFDARPKVAKAPKPKARAAKKKGGKR